MKVLGVAAAVAGIGILAFPTGSDSCGIAPPVPVFATAQGPADLAGQFLKGRIGVIRPSYDRRHLIAAYRILNGNALSAKEADGLYRESGQPLGGLNPPTEVWRQARSLLPGGKNPNYFDTYKTKQTAGSFLYYPNCLADAFDTAARTFKERAKSWGADSPQLREWATAQDQVFANCSGEKVVIPPEPEAGMDSLLVSDRRYQIAAAYFYAGDWPKARAAFELVAKDDSSPWRSVAPYLIARTFLREGTIENKRDALQEAAEHFEAITKDPGQQQWHAAASKLLEYARLRIDPSARLAELGSALMETATPNAGQAAADYLYLMKRSDPEEVSATSDLADWMLAFEGHSQNTGNYALNVWKKTRSPAWLIAALVRGNGTEAIEAARHVDRRSPEYEAATYYGLLRETDAAKKLAWADEALRQDLLLSTRNLILTERLKLARDWSEFLRFAPRKPEPKLESWDGSEAPAEKPPVSTGTAALFDRDSTVSLNSRVPLSLWEDAARNRSLPAHLQLEIAQAGWVRAVLLGKDAEARQLMGRLTELQPRADRAAHDFLTAADLDAARFAAAFLLLRNTELTPFVPGAAGAVDLNEVHTLGDVEWGFAGNCAALFAPPPAPEAGFLTAAQQAENKEEWKQLAATAPAGASFLAAQTFAWAAKHPDDPRAPEALRLLVQTGRRACRDDHTVENGRRAFMLLHQRYPNSEWTKKTKYWYQ